MEFELSTLLLLTAVGFLGGFIDSIAGGGGLITVPALLATGMPPYMALGTNKLQGCFGSFMATAYFFKRGLINLNSMKWAIFFTFFGSASGALLVQAIDADFLSLFLPFLLILFAGYFLFSPRVSNEDSQERLTPWTFAWLIGFSVGFYDGFFGPGTGSFFAIAFIALAGMGIAKATAHTKLLNFTSNFAAVIFFALNGQILWDIGLAMAIGQLLGARLGARMVISQGVNLVKPLLVGISLLICIRMVWLEIIH